LPDASPPSVARRDRAIRLTVAASVAAKVFSVACTFVQVPIALRYLGAEAYGFWVTLVGIVLVLNTVDFGLGVGMQHAMARAFGREEVESMKRSFWTGVAVLSLLGAAVLAAGLPVARFGSWADHLHIHDPELRSETAAALMVAIATFVAGLPFNAVSRLAVAVQHGWINAGWIAAGNALSLGLVAAAAHWRWGFLWFLTASLLVPTLQGTGLFIHLLRVLGWSLRPSRLAPASEIRVMLRSSLYYAFPQFGMALIQSAPALAISVAAGSISVTGYNLLMRLFSPFQQGQLILLGPVWPAYTEAQAKADHSWVKRTFGRTVLASFALAAGLAVAAWQSHRLLSLWIGNSAGSVAPRLAALVAAWSLVQMAAQPFMYYLMGVGRLRLLAWVGTPGLMAGVGALFWGARAGTVDAVLIAGSATLAVTLLPPLAWASMGTLRKAADGGEHS
jgi:O-antigen/teichoic acid export membrane protein